MGRYINPGNEGFRLISKRNYVDKTGIIELVNDRIGTNDNLVCISRPRRFGKSYAAKTISAYYDCSVDSHELYDGLLISQSEDYETHLNKYYVIQLDITSFIKNNKDNDIVNSINNALVTDIKASYPQYKDIDELFDILFRLVKDTNRKIIVVIDEWDAIIREYNDHFDVQQSYLNFLRRFFKDSTFTPDCIAAAYMTGILPIKKIKGESAISDFKEYTVLRPGKFAGYVGFNTKEVKTLCQKHDMDFDRMKWWYDGYTMGNATEIYNPYSVMCAIESGEYSSYWQQTSAAESLKKYINMDYKGLQEDILRLLSGEPLEVNTRSFKNDFVSFSSKNEVLTLLLHLGYLTFNKNDGTANIPNEEIRYEFKDLLEDEEPTRIINLVQKSNRILQDTLAGNEDAVASAIDAIRQSEYAPTFYNDEQALRYVIKFAYIICVDKYMKVEELPSGKGIADVVFIPKKRTVDPAIIVELKWDKTADAAIGQIKEKGYIKVLEDYVGEVVLVGLNYDPKVKNHTCKIEKIQISR